MGLCISKQAANPAGRQQPTGTTAGMLSGILRRTSTNPPRTLPARQQQIGSPTVGSPDIHAAGNTNYKDFTGAFAGLFSPDSNNK